jgi:hypothetical protein
MSQQQTQQDANEDDIRSIEEQQQKEDNDNGVGIETTVAALQVIIL